MANRINIRCRRLIALFCIILLFSTFLPVRAFADSVTVSTSYSPSYFQTFNSKGQWVGIGTPQHYIVETGQPVFCVQTEKTEPSNAPYTEVDGERVFSTYEVRRGIEIILQNGYPTTTGGFTDDEARYATANAIRFFLVDCGEPYVPGWMNLNSFSQFFRAAPGYEELWQWCLYLRSLANNQASIPASNHRISLSASSLNLTEDGLNYTGSFTVTLTGCEGGYELDESALPFGSGVAGYSGCSGDVLTVLIPTDYSGGSYTLRLIGKGYQADSGLMWYSPYNTSLQNVVTYVGVNTGELVNATTAQIQLNTPAAAEKKGSIKVHKVSTTGEALADAMFELILPSGESMFAFSHSAGIAEFTDLPLGLYKLQEHSAPPGYIKDDNLYSISLAFGTENVEVTIINSPEIITGSLRVLKTDPGGNPLKGAMFALTTPENTEIYAYSGEDGVATFNDLPLGDYTLRENAAPEGYVKDENTYPVSLTASNKNVELTVVNAPEILKGSLKVLKTAPDGTPLKDAMFTLTTPENTELYASSGEDGIAMFNDLPLGEYILKENTAPAGYVKDENSYTVNITAKGEVVEKTIINEKEIIKSRIIIHKRDVRGNGLMGAVFKLEMSTDSGITWELIDSYTSDESGDIVIPDLISDGNIGYRITETSTAPGYILHSEPIFTGSLADYGNAELSLTVCNCPNITMPFTGGEGFNHIYTITGLMILMGLIILKRRNANEEN